jgi:DNA-binding NarL/FixJ family response regulator
MLEAGAIAFVSKHAPEDELLETIRQACAWITSSYSGKASRLPRFARGSVVKLPFRARR